MQNPREEQGLCPLFVSLCLRACGPPPWLSEHWGAGTLAPVFKHPLRLLPPLHASPSPMAVTNRWLGGWQGQRTWLHKIFCFSFFFFSITADLQRSVNFRLHSEVTQWHIHVYILFPHMIIHAGMRIHSPRADHVSHVSHVTPLRLRCTWAVAYDGH